MISSTNVKSPGVYVFEVVGKPLLRLAQFVATSLYSDLILISWEMASHISRLPRFLYIWGISSRLRNRLGSYSCQFKVCFGTFDRLLS